MAQKDSASKENDFLSRLTADSDDGTDMIDNWNTEELLLLSSSVVRSDRNWASVARSIKPFGDQMRPSDWYNARNCALQYTKLLNEIDEDSKKKTLPRTERETPEVTLVKNLTDRRLNELSWLNQQTLASANILRHQMEMIENGHLDEADLDDLIKEIDEQEKREIENHKQYISFRDNLSSAKKLNVSRHVKAATKTVEARKPKTSELIEEMGIRPMSESGKIEKKIASEYLTPPKPVLSKTKIESPHLSALLDSKITPTPPNSPMLTSYFRTISSSASTVIVNSPPKEEEIQRRSHSDPSSSPLLNSLLKNSPSMPLSSPGKEVSPKSTSLSQAFNILNAATRTENQQAALPSNLPRFLHNPVSPDAKKNISSSPTACQSAPYLSKLLEMPPSTPGRLPPLPVIDSPSPSTTSLETISKTIKPVISVEMPLVTEIKVVNTDAIPIVLEENTEDVTILQNCPQKYAVAIQNNVPNIKSGIFNEEVNDPIEDVVTSSFSKQDLQSIEATVENIDLDACEVLMEAQLEIPAEETPKKTSDIATKATDVPCIDLTEDDKDGIGESTSKDLEDVYWEVDSSSPDKNPIAIESDTSTHSVITIYSTDASESTQKIQDILPNENKLQSSQKHLFEKGEFCEEETQHAVKKATGRKAKKGRGRPPKVPKPDDEARDQYEFSDNTDDNITVESTSPNTLCYMPRKEEDSKDSDDSNPVIVAEKLCSPNKNKQSKVSGRKTLFSLDEQTADWLITDETTSHLSEDKLKEWEESCSKKAQESKVATDDSKVANQLLKSSEIIRPQMGKKLASGKVVSVNKERKLSGIDSEEVSRDSDIWQKDNVVDLELETSSSLPAESDVDKATGESEGGVTFSSHIPPSHTGGKQDWFHSGSPKSSEAVSQSSDSSDSSESDTSDNQSGSTNKSTTIHLSHQRHTRKERESPQYKAWKKAISIVHREVSCHKYANVFLQKVTNDVAPGYLSIVNRPMDLSLIKKNIDNGQIRTTEEFERDMLLMFQNAIMYNSSDHDVYKMAVVMQKDVMEQIKVFLTTQSTDVEQGGEVTSALRGGRKSAKGKHVAAGKNKEESLDH